MLRKGLWILGLVALVAALAPAALAESHEEAEKPAGGPPPLYFVWTDHVTPANAAAYEAEVKRVMAEIKATEAGEKMQFFTVAGDGGYSYVTSLADMAEFAEKSADFMAATEAVGGMEAWDASNALVSHGSGQFLVLLADISYTPAAPREAEAKGQFRMHEWWYIQPGKEAQVMDIARRFAELYKAKGVDTGWRFYQAVTGEDLPLFLVSSTAMDAADYYTNDARVSEMLGEEAATLIQEAVAIARRVERTTAMVRPDLSMGM